MPSISSVRRTGRCDCSTRRMISAFSEAGYLMRRPPQPRSCFFEQAVLQREIGHSLLQGAGLAPQRLDLVRRGGPGGVAGQALLASLQELLGPAVYMDEVMPSRRHNSAMLSSPRKPSSTMRILSSAEKGRRVARRMSLTMVSAGALAGPDVCFIFAPHGYDEPDILRSCDPLNLSDGC